MAARLREPGLSRAFLFLVLGTIFSAAIIVIFREWYGFELWVEDKSLTLPILAAALFATMAVGLIANRSFLITLSVLGMLAWAVAWAIWGLPIEGKAQNAILLLSMLLAPIWFLIGLGAFDYWFYWAAGKPTRPEDHSGHGAYSWKDYFRVNTDHKVIGIQYVVTSFFFMLVGGLLAMLVRAELAQPGKQFVDANAFNGLFSVHASLMIFLFIIPVFAGLANYVLPLMIGAPDMAFPRLNALSYWMLPIAGIMMTASFFAPGGSFATGWTAYAPLSTTAPVGQMFFTIGVQFAGASSIATALNFLVTIITMRAPGMSFWRMPLLVWANFSTSLLVVIATPFIAASQFFVLLDYALGFNFFNPSANGDVLMYQHVFWFYS
ncbi:MAG TPA: cbb3-type cytochrome c oxidase subunit I, partial [Solirubrobacter sp.]|nr:cbb3-type cytochrome c oxidase subunit I [Solirubrobacter sp.]